MSSDQLPVVNIAPLRLADQQARRPAAERITRAAREVGAFYLVNHGISNVLIEAVFGCSRDFHGLPLGDKLHYHIRHSFGNRGYVPAPQTDDDTDAEPADLFKRASPNGSTEVNSYASFDLGLDLPADDPDFRAGNLMLGPNVWPQVPHFKETVSEYYTAIRELGDVLASALAQGLGLDGDFFTRHATKPASQLRLLHYPENDQPVPGDDDRIKPHTDYELFTLVIHQGGGLEIVHRDGGWIAAPAIGTTIVVLLGDMLELWTNGYLRSTLHRVANTGKERLSIPFFYGLDYYTRVEPIQAFVGGTDEVTYEPMVAGEHLLNFTIKGCKHLRRRLASGSLVLAFEPRADNPFKERALAELATRRGAPDERHAT